MRRNMVRLAECIALANKDIERCVCVYVYSCIKFWTILLAKDVCTAMWKWLACTDLYDSGPYSNGQGWQGSCSRGSFNQNGTIQSIKKQGYREAIDWSFGPNQPTRLQLYPDPYCRKWLIWAFVLLPGILTLQPQYNRRQYDDSDDDYDL